MKGESDVDILSQFGVIFFVCLAGEGIAAILPVSFPASVISMILLLFLLLAGVIKEGYIRNAAGVLMAHMAFFLLPSYVGIMEHMQVLLPRLVPVLAICLLTTPLVYLVTAWTVQGVIALSRKRKGEQSHA